MSYILHVDNREHDLWEALQNMNTPSEKVVLPIGDILLRYDNTDIVLFERKTIADLLASIKDGRYDEQSHRLMHSSGLNTRHQIVYIIEGGITGLSVENKRIVSSAIISLQFIKGFQVHRTFTVVETATYLHDMCIKLTKESQKGKHIYVTNDSETQDYVNVVKKVKKENITPDNIGEICISQIPSVSSATAKAIMKNYQHIKDLLYALENVPDCLSSIALVDTKGKSRKISRTAITNIYTYLGIPIPIVEKPIPKKGKKEKKELTK